MSPRDMAALALGVAVCLWALAAIFVRVPDRPFPQFTNLRLLEEWQRRCSELHLWAQRRLRNLFTAFAIVGALVAVVVQVFPVHGIVSSDAAAVLSVGILLFAFVTIAAGPRLAERWEHAARSRLRDRLNAAEAAKYHVTLIPQTPAADMVPDKPSAAFSPEQKALAALGFWEGYVRPGSWK